MRIGICGLLIFKEGAKAIQWGKDFLLTDDTETVRYSHAKKKGLRPLPHIVNSTWIIDLKVGAKTRKHRKKKNLNDLVLSKEFLTMTPKTWAIK